MNQEMRAFLLKEFNVKAFDLENFTSEQFQKIYDDCYDIEVGEALKGDPISDRGRIAADLVTYLYQTYAEPLEE